MSLISWRFHCFLEVGIIHVCTQVDVSMSLKKSGPEFLRFLGKGEP